MALENLISIEFTQQEKDTLNTALGNIENVLKNKVINLTPEERQQYGRIANKTEDWIRKIKEYMDKYPDFVPRYVDSKEYSKDFQSRKDIEPVLKRLAILTEKLDDTQKLISSDLYQNAISFYRNVKLSAQENVPGSSTVYKDLQAQFPGKGAKGTIKQEPSLN